MPMTARVHRFRCPIVHANGDRCTRPEPHRPDGIHSNGKGHTWGARNVPEGASS